MGLLVEICLIFQGERVPRLTSRDIPILLFPATAVSVRVDPSTSETFIFIVILEYIVLLCTEDTGCNSISEKI